MKALVSFAHAWLAAAGGRTVEAGGDGAWLQPTRPSNSNPDKAAPALSDTDMVTPPLFRLFYECFGGPTRNAARSLLRFNAESIAPSPRARDYCSQRAPSQFRARA